MHDIMREVDMRLMIMDKPSYNYHNSILDLIARHGMFTCISFYLLLISLLVRNFFCAIRSPEEKEGAQHTVLIILVFLLNGLTESVYLNRSIWLYFMAFLAIQPSFKVLRTGKPVSGKTVSNNNFRKLCF